MMRIFDFVPLLAVGALLACGGPTRLELEPNQKTVFAVQEEFTPTLKGFDEEGQSVEVGEAEWSVTDAAVATVTETGTVRSLAAGTTTVAAKVGDISAQMMVKVIPISSVQVVPSDVRLIGPRESSVPLVAKISDANGIPVTETVRWSSSDPAVVEVAADGVVTSKGEGKAKITAAIGDFKGEASVIVQLREIVRVVVHPETTVMRKGETEVFSASVYDEKAVAIANVAVEWSSTNADVAKVDVNGTVKALASGTCEIQASFAGKTAFATVIVQ